MTQAEALDILKMGKNVFLTGPAGSGKTFVLNSYVEYLKSNAVDVAVTASTGIAATHLGGMTIHSWSGLGIRSTLTDYDIEDMMSKQYLYKRFERTKVLIIDEVSMLHHFRLDLIEWICRQFKHNDSPFGGMQIILSGDFFQLPPVTRGDVLESEFAYKADSWARSDFTICHLSEQHRQKDDVYLEILNQIRQNNVSKKTLALLQSRINQDPESGAEPTKLFTHNVDVDVINHRHLDLIEGDIKKFIMTSRGSPGLVESLKKSCLSPETLVLKLGARVMFTKNSQQNQYGEDYQHSYVNGTLGVVSDFNSFGDPVIRTIQGNTFSVSPASWKIEEEGKIKAEISQLPLRLAWAITVHKSQGMSLDAMEVDLSKSFVRGMGYVALSRVRSLGGMKLLGYNAMALQVDTEVLAQDALMRDMSEDTGSDLKEMTRGEITAVQNEFMKKIEPDEKKKIKIKEGKIKKEQNKSTHDITADLLAEKMSIGEMAETRKMTQETIISHIEKLIELKTNPDFAYLRDELGRGEFKDMLEAFAKAKTKTLAPVYNILDKNKKNPSYLKLRLARLFLEK